VHKERFGADLLRRLCENRAAGRSQQRDGSADPDSFPRPGLPPNTASDGAEPVSHVHEAMAALYLCCVEAGAAP